MLCDLFSERISPLGAILSFKSRHPLRGNSAYMKASIRPQIWPPLEPLDLRINCFLSKFLGLTTLKKLNTETRVYRCKNGKVTFILEKKVGNK